MGLVTGALAVGKSALSAYQGALFVIGNNIANAGSTSYVRQNPILEPIPGQSLGDGVGPGGGVRLTQLKRNVDEALESRLRNALGDQNSALVQQQTLARVEALFNELSEFDLSSQLNEFFNAFNDVQNTPENLATRDIVINTAVGLTNDLQRVRSDLVGMFEQLNGQATDTVDAINNLAHRIGRLNVDIVAAQSSGGGAAALQDQRDQALRDLATLTNINVKRESSGSYNIFIGSEPLLEQARVRELGITLEAVDGLATAVVRFTDDNALADVSGGDLDGVISARSQVANTIQKLDAFASAIIQDVNQIHSEGQGLAGWTQVTGAFAVEDSTVALNDEAAGLDLTPVNGSFLIQVTGIDGSTSTTQIDVDLDGIGTDMSLDDLAAAIDAVSNMSASVTPDGELSMTADPNFSITFAEDSSNVLAALGVNVFFVGSNARDIAVNMDLAADPNLLAVATSGEPGDGSNAGRLAALATQTSATVGTKSLMDFYSGMINEIAVCARAARNATEAADVIVGSLEAQRESVSGVSLDEEATQLMQFQRAFQGAARYISVIDGLIDEMLALVR